jgi:5-methyltetrahydrofolate--homocysteine methyltransferase
MIMRDDLEVLNDSDIDVPVILGGAALTRKYVEGDLREIYHGPLYYAKDAFEGLNLMRQIAEGSAVEAPAATATTSASQEGGIASAVEAKTTQKGVEQVGERSRAAVRPARGCRLRR